MDVFRDAVNEYISLRQEFRLGPPTLNEAMRIGARINELLAFIMDYRDNNDLTIEPDARTNAMFLEWVLQPS
ncbi:MAG: hypothetical protein ABL962_01915 [Fimbriimonadaceae bacterium]